MQNDKWHNFRNDIYEKKRKINGVIGIKSIQHNIESNKINERNNRRELLSFCNKDSLSIDPVRSSFNTICTPRQKKNYYDGLVYTNLDKKENILSLLNVNKNIPKKENINMHHKNNKVHYIFNEVVYPSDFVGKLKKKFPDYNQYFKRVVFDQARADCPRIDRMKKEIYNLC